MYNSDWTRMTWRVLLISSWILMGQTHGLSGHGVVGMDGRTFHKVLDGTQPALIRFAKARSLLR